MSNPREPNTEEAAGEPITDFGREPNTTSIAEEAADREPNTESFREPNTEN